MKKSNNIFIVTIISILFAMQLSIIAFAKENIPEHTSNFYVNDFAGVFSESEVQRLVDNAVTLSDKSDGIQVVVTTIESLNGNSIESYAVNMYNTYEIGKDDMGLLILLSTGDRQIRVEVGRAMEAYITDSKAGRYIDNYAIPYLKENKFNDGLISLQEALISEITSQVEKENLVNSNMSSKTSSTLNGNEENKFHITSSKDSNKSSSGILKTILLISFIVLLVVAFITVYLLMQDKLKKAYEENANLERKLKEEKNNCKETIKNMQNLFDKEKQSITDNFNRHEENFKNNYEGRIEKYECQISILNKDKEELSNELFKLEKKYSSLNEKFERAVKLHPDLYNEINKMVEDEKRQYDMQKANEVDSLISDVINLSPDKNIVERLNSAITSYSSLQESQKAYVQSDISKLQQLYNDSLALKKEYERQQEEERIRRQEEKYKEDSSYAYNEISKIISAITVGTEDNLDSLKKAEKLYGNLSAGAKKYFDHSIMKKVNSLVREAESDHSKKEKTRRDKKIAASAIASITAIIGFISYGKAKDLRKLKEARKIYDDLSSDAKQYVDKSVIDKLDTLIREAKRDKEQEEEEERRRKNREEEERRMRMNSSSSSFGSSNGYHFGGSSHSGFGGHSNGGGASRGF